MHWSTLYVKLSQRNSRFNKQKMSWRCFETQYDSQARSFYEEFEPNTGEVPANTLNAVPCIKVRLASTKLFVRFSEEVCVCNPSLLFHFESRGPSLGNFDMCFRTEKWTLHCVTQLRCRSAFNMNLPYLSGLFLRGILKTHQCTKMIIFFDTTRI